MPQNKPPKLINPKEKGPKKAQFERKPPKMFEMKENAPKIRSIRGETPQKNPKMSDFYPNPEN